MLEVTDACIDVWGADRVGMHLAPRMDAHDMGDSDRLGTFSYVARELGKRKLGWIAAREAVMDENTQLVDSQGKPRFSAHKESIGPRLKEIFGGPFIANEGFDQASAEKALAEGRADAIAFGKLFIANPDLVERFAEPCAAECVEHRDLLLPAAPRAIPTIRRCSLTLPQSCLVAQRNLSPARYVSVL